jgi:hypothetical protein
MYCYSCRPRQRRLRPQSGQSLPNYWPSNDTGISKLPLRKWTRDEYPQLVVNKTSQESRGLFGHCVQSDESYCWNLLGRRLCCCSDGLNRSGGVGGPRQRAASRHRRSTSCVCRHSGNDRVSGGLSLFKVSITATRCARGPARGIAAVWIRNAKDGTRCGRRSSSSMLPAYPHTPAPIAKRTIPPNRLCCSTGRRPLEAPA